MTNRQGFSGNYNAIGNSIGNNTFSGSKGPFATISEEHDRFPTEPLSEYQWKRLTSKNKFGGDKYSRGQSSTCACTLCFRLGHTFEFCKYMNGFIQGGPPMERYGIPKPQPPPKKLGQQGPLLRLTQ
jgi:hypothetical protein